MLGSTPVLIWIVPLYFAAVMGIAQYRGRRASLDDYLIGGRKSLWWMITLGMISDTVSGVTYISVPGLVAATDSSYLQLIFGHFVGYFLIAMILLPIYYRGGFISIYVYLRNRFGPNSEKTGAFLFILSRLFGAAARLYIAALVLHQYFFGFTSLSPIVTFVFIVGFILLYTYRGGIKTVVWTDAFQSIFLVLGIGLVFVTLWKGLPHPFATITAPTLFHWDITKPNFFGKEFLAGIFITVAMNGLDQHIMQKNLSIPELGGAQKNMLTFAFVFLAVNFLFIGLGALLMEAYRTNGFSIPLKANGQIFTDRLLPNLVFNHLGQGVALFFVLGLCGALLSSADSVLPALASSVEINLLPVQWRNRIPVRALHFAMAILLLVTILLLYALNTGSLIDLVLRYSGYTNGPLLGLFAWGILSRREIVDRRIPAITIAAIALTAIVDYLLPIGYEVILINAGFFVGLVWAFGRKRSLSVI